MNFPSHALGGNPQMGNKRNLAPYVDQDLSRIRVKRAHKLELVMALVSEQMF
jgi:hypothetical protein